MKYLKKFNERLFPWDHKLTDDEFKQIWDYFCFDVFNEKRRHTINSVIFETLEYIDFLEPKGYQFDEGWEFDLSKTLNPYYGVASSSCTAFLGLSYEFQSEINTKRYEIDNCKGWKHLFKSAIESIGWEYSFGKKTHGYPYYEYKLNLLPIGNWGDRTKEDVTSLMKKRYWDLKEDESVSRHIKKVIGLSAEAFGRNLNISVGSNPDRFDRFGCPFDIRLVDLDFEPKENIITSTNII